MPSISQPHDSHVGRLERVVVALDRRARDQVRAERRRRSPRPRRTIRRASRAQARVGVDEPAAAEARVEVQAARDAVDVVVAERRAHLVEVVVGELVRVVELVAVDQVAEARRRRGDLVGDRLVVACSGW